MRSGNYQEDREQEDRKQEDRKQLDKEKGTGGQGPGELVELVEGDCACRRRSLTQQPVLSHSNSSSAFPC